MRENAGAYKLVKAFGIISIFIGLSLFGIAIANLLLDFDKQSPLLSQLIRNGIIALIGGIAVYRKKIFGKWLFFFVGFFGILKNIINIPINIFLISSIESAYPHFYRYFSVWLVLFLTFALYLFLIIFFLLPSVNNVFKDKR